MSPASFRHYGIAYGVGSRREPAAAGRTSRSALPLMLAGLRAGRAPGCRGRGSRARALAPVGARGDGDGEAVRRPGLGDGHRARAAGSSSGAAGAQARAARDRAVDGAGRRRAPSRCARTSGSFPSGVELPVEVGEEAEPPEILYAGRLSPEKGVRELVAAADGLPLVVVGDGPLRDEVPGRARVPPARRARAALRACGGRCVPVASRGVRGRLRRGDGPCGGRSSPATSAGFATSSCTRRPGCSSHPATWVRCGRRSSRLLGDADLRRRFGEAGRARIAEHFTWQRFADETLRAYEDALH